MFKKKLNYTQVLKPILDVKTRWNSTYVAWNHLIYLKNAILDLNKMDSDRDVRYDFKRSKKNIIKQ